MRSKLCAVVLFILFLPVLSFSQQVNISISDDGYRNEVFRFYTITDPVTGQLKPLLKAVADSTGRLEASLAIDGEQYLIIKTGFYYLTLFTGDREKYELKLPPFRRKSVADELNPFYNEQKMIPLVINDTTCINNRIREFESHFNRIFDTVSESIFNNGNTGDTSSFSRELDKYFATDTVTFFGNYARCKKTIIDLMTFTSVSSKIDKTTFLFYNFDIKNPANTDLVNQLFGDYFNDAGSEQTEAAIVTAIRSGSFNKVSMAVAGNMGAGGILNDYIAVLNLYNQYFTGRYAPAQVMKLLSDASASSVFEDIRNLAAITVEKISRLQPGSTAPRFSMPGTKGDTVASEDFKGRYILLNFARADSYASISEFSIMKMWEERYGSDIKIITILTDRNFREAAARMEKAGYAWEMLDGSADEKLLYYYEVKMLPLFVLIDREGRIVLAPAMLPSERLEQKISSMIQQDRIRSGLVK